MLSNKPEQSEAIILLTHCNIWNNSKDPSNNTAVTFTA